MRLSTRVLPLAVLLAMIAPGPALGLHFGGRPGAHDTRALLHALLALAVRTDDAALRDRVQPGVVAALAPVP